MEYRTLGRTGLRVSTLGLGGHTYPVGREGFCSLEDRAWLVAQLVAGGVNYFDTTWLNEVELLADSFLRAGVGAGCHVSLQYVDGISDPSWREKLRGELERRLAVLGYSHAPLFLMGVGNHCPELGEIVSALEAMARLREEGLIRWIGLSCHELSRFGALADAIEQTDLVDYLMLRFNPKYQQAAERLLPIARSRNVGIVGMKVFCWDCGPDQWGRRISVFEPVDPAERTGAVLTPAQESLRWVLQQPGLATTVPAMNAAWEVEQNLRAVADLRTPVDTSGFSRFQDRLWDPAALAELAQSAESAAIRQRAAALLKQ